MRDSPGAIKRYKQIESKTKGKIHHVENYKDKEGHFIVSSTGKLQEQCIHTQLITGLENT
jgi:hypothetical protein